MEFCHSFGKDASLVVIETQLENNYLKKWLLKHGDPNTGVWVGGSDNGHHGIWTWFPTGDLIRWWDWGPGQPKGEDQHCLYVVGGWLGYQWADFHCDFQMTFMCEYKIQTKNVWDYYSPVPHRNKEYIPVPIKKMRPNSKITKDAIPKNQNIIQNDDIFSNSVNQPGLHTELESKSEEKDVTTLFSIIDDYDDSSDLEIIKSDENKIITDLGTWTILKLIENVFTIAFLKQ